MTFSVSAELEELIRQKVKSGLYDSASQVVAEALLLLEERDQLRGLRRERLLRELANGISQADNRQLIPAEEVFAHLLDQAKVIDK